MTAIVVLIGISLVVASGFLLAFLYSARRGQFDDTISPAVRMLFDEPQPRSEKPSEPRSKRAKP